MTQTSPNRRQFLKTTAGVAAALTLNPYIHTGEVYAEDSPNERLNIAAIGVGGRGSGIGRQAAGLGNMLACCDVDTEHAQRFASSIKRECKTYVDYRKLLDREDIDAVTIGTPDHWHTKIAIDAMRAGKDVYCEKPLTLTIEEGKQICRVVKQTGKVFQVGTQQRSEYGAKFLKAVAIARSGRLGKTLKAVSSVGPAASGGPFSSTKPPAHLNWEMWQGQAPWAEYKKERVHHNFRWWQEYSGGQVTDWGVHHTDIAMWALGLEQTGPTKISGVGNFNKQKDCYNVAQNFDCTAKFNGGHQIQLVSNANELIISGEKGKIRVNRGNLTGKPVEEIAADKAATDQLNADVEKLYRGMRMAGHMQNFFDCVKSRKLPISDVFTHHRSVSVCHLANIAMLLGRPLTWNPENEDFVGDAEATAMLSREQRKPYEIDA